MKNNLNDFKDKPDTTDETGEAKQMSPEEMLWRRQTIENRGAAAQAIQKHFNFHPDTVMVCSTREGVAQVSVTPHTSLAEVIYMQRLLNHRIDTMINETISRLHEEADKRASEKEQAAPGLDELKSKLMAAAAPMETQ